jgi:threonine dehydrogenase-like Zn-dependent dehydrogenase
MTKRSQQVVFYQDGEVSLVRRPLSDPAAGEVILRMDTLGLCSSDFHIWGGRKRAAPGVLGHEGAGTVVAVGPGVEGWAAGDFAVVNPLLACSECGPCLAGQGHICGQRQIIGYNGRGLIGDYILLEARSLFRPPSALSRKYACLVEPLSCVIHAQRRLRLPAEETMLILGAGPMGVMHAAYARHRGVRRLWLADLSPEKLTLARSAGCVADEFLDAREAPERVQGLSRGRGADVTVLANSTREGHELAFKLTAHGGQVLAFASIYDHPGPLWTGSQFVDSDGVHAREESVEVETPRGTATLVGAIGFDADSFGASAVVLSHSMDPESFVTSEVSLDDIPALAAGRWQEQIKIIVYPVAQTAALQELL